MAILENIRKRTTVLILIIGMALFAFVISGIFTGNDFGGTKVGSSIAEINGDEISIDEFRRKMERASRFSQATSSMQLVNSIWNQVERQTILGQQFEELGIAIEQDQIINVIRNNPGIASNPQFQDENGNFDEIKFREFIADLRVNAPSQYQDWLLDEESIVQTAKEQTYFNLIKAGVGATLKEGELDYKLSNTKMDLRYIRIPYTSIPDSTVTVSEDEIEAYIKDHKDEFKQEKARDIQFVYFEDKPSEEDEKNIEEELNSLLSDRMEYLEELDSTVTIPGFRSTTDNMAFLDRNSDSKFDTIFRAKNQLPSDHADALMDLEVGELYGPYRDGDVLKISKLVARKPNGSVKASHILISYQGAERAAENITRSKEEAEARAEELLEQALDPNTTFTQLARDNSDGPSAPQGGDLGYFQEGIMTPKFNDFAFGNPVDYIGMVETPFGYHIVKVDDKQDLIQLATLTRDIEPSEDTINTLFTEATTFEMEVTESEASFNEAAEKANQVVRPVNKIGALDENLPGLGPQRTIVQWAFNDDTDVGDIRRFNIGNGYAVVQLTAKYKEGLMSVEDASVTVLPKIRKEKKAAMIKSANVGKDLENLAADNNTVIATATALTVKNPTIPGAGNEPLVVGTAYTMEQGEVSGLIEGETGVFKIEVTRKEVAPDLENYSTYANTLKTANASRVNNAAYTALKERSEVEDNRSIFY